MFGKIRKEGPRVEWSFRKPWKVTRWPVQMKVGRLWKSAVEGGKVEQAWSRVWMRTALQMGASPSLTSAIQILELHGVHDQTRHGDEREDPVQVLAPCCTKADVIPRYITQSYYRNYGSAVPYASNVIEKPHAGGKYISEV